MILYLHGFASSSGSAKVKSLQAFPDVTIVSFDLDVGPFKAIKQISSFIEEHIEKDIMLMGSSLGGYYALHISAIFDLPAVLINPSMEPFKTLARFVDSRVQNYSKDESFIYKQQYVDELKTLVIDQANQKKILLMLQTGDENLDYKTALHALPQAQHLVQEGGNHSFEHFDRNFSLIKTFYDKHFSD